MAEILVIDDEPELRSVMRRILERQGHTVQEADNGDTGLALVQARRPDIVVTDLFMPDKEGIETIMELRERFPEVPVIAVSGADGGEESGPLVDAKMLGAAAILAKPFSVQGLLDRVDEVLGADTSDAGPLNRT